MYKLPKGGTTDAEREILRKLRVWIAALAVACLVGGVGLGALLAGRPAVAQNEAQIARAPEALSASFVEIARRVESAVVNIDTVSQAEIGSDAEEDDDADSSSLPNNPLMDMFRQRMQQRMRRLRAASGAASSSIRKDLSSRINTSSKAQHASPSNCRRASNCAGASSGWTKRRTSRW